MVEGKKRMVLKVLLLIVVVAALLYRFGRPYVIRRRLKDAVDWPETDATIQSGDMELVERVGHLRERLPFFAFSYLVDNEYYSGRFGLRVPEDRASTLMKERVNTKITVRYDPKRPSVFSLPDEVAVDGFRVSTVPEIDLASRH
jgi:hypothetical protein